MFTGIVRAIGFVDAVMPKGGDVELRLRATSFDLSSIALGDSIACSGCCLTVTRLALQSFCVDVSLESLNVTTLRNWQVGTEVNLESALRAGDALGGHYVTGHVDGTAKVVALTEDARSLRVAFDLPQDLGRYVARKGSICVDGVSLTVNSVRDLNGISRFDVNLIPLTRTTTILRNYVVGTLVNIEVDIIARYLERMQGAGQGTLGMG